MASGGERGMEGSSDVFSLGKDTEQVMLANVSSEQSFYDIQNPELQKCMEEITDLIMEAIPKAEYVSLLNDYVESEFFMIDGDSLFITCARELTLHQGQNLHFFYLVERFLQDLTSKGAKYVLVFFKDAEHIYYRNPDLLSLRTALIIHLRNYTQTPVHAEFSNCLVSSWQNFLEENNPYFLIIADEGLDQLQTNFLHICIIHTLSKKINIVLTSGQQSDAIRIYGYHIHNVYDQWHFFQQHKTKIKNLYQTLLTYMERSSSEASLSLSGYPSLETLATKIHAKITSLEEIEELRYIVCIVTCSLILEKYNQDNQTSVKQTKPALTLQEAEDLLRMYCLSVVFLHHVPLSQRAQIRLIKNKWNEETFMFIQQHKLCESVVLKNLTTQTSWKIDFSVLPDLSDNLLWKNIAFYYEAEKHSGFDLDIGTKIERDYELLWKHIITLLGTFRIGNSFPLRITTKHFLEDKCLTSKGKELKKTFPNPGLIPITNTLVNAFTGDILTDLPFLKSDDPVVVSLKKQKDFDELLHWHSRRPLSDDYDRTKGDFDANDPWALRKRQQLQTFQRFYGQSLEGIKSKTIVTRADNPKKVYTDAKKSKKMHKTKAEMIVEENQKRRQAEENKKEERRWAVLSVTIEEKIKENMTSGMKCLQEFLKNCQSALVKCTAEMAALNICFGTWMECCDKGKISANLDEAVGVMRIIHSVLINYDDLLKETDFQQIGKYLRALGFDNLAVTLKYVKDLEDEGKKPKRKVSKYAVGVGSSRFQLQYMGPYLIREERKDPDPRVQHFIPDTWQRELLDIVDNNESAVIVAPTSSGKTYASYYCMEKILRESDDGVVVYVAPTKALVNQVWATIDNRFNKALPSGLTVCGVFTRDYRHDALNSQILVTVPQCLEILLLSPHRQKWAQKIRYVIFDEVHCLGGEIGAEVWEHLLVMIRCPFLALSATISNPKHLTEWLQSVKRYWQHTEAQLAQNSTAVKKGAKGKKSTGKQKESYKVKLVEYKERYNDLEKYVCSLKNDDFAIDHYHPCAAVTVDHIEKYGFPLDLSLSPREAVLLYDTMVKVRENWPGKRGLDPEEFFKDKIIITKTEARQYEKQLKEELEMWIKHGLQNEAKEVLQLLKPQPSCSAEKEMRTNFPRFVEKLHQMDKLPALFFLFKIKAVEDRAKEVCKALEEKQENKQIPGSEKEQLLTKKRKKIEKSLANQKADKKVSREDDKTITKIAELESLMDRLEKIAEIPSDCTYANDQAVDKGVLWKIIGRTRFMKKHKELQKLALRGIGYHHASLDRKGRQMVEMLFRMGFMQLVTATGTLALGINMPCKSVIFLQNSVYLDALNYRQMSGRAGRRGQDLLGNVFFYDIPLPKIQKLMKSNVPELRGQFPLTISLILRVMLLASKADDKEDAQAKALSLLKHSLLSFKQPRALAMLKLYFLFSLQFLVKEGYVDRDGNTTGFSGLVTHLHYHEPSNIVLVEFLVKGLFHKLCQRSKEGSRLFSETVMEKLVLVLAHLFGRKHIPAAVVNSKRKFYQSKVFLEDLPEDFAAALHEYNCKIQENFGQFLQKVSTMADMKQEYQLPLSELDFSGTEQLESQLAGHLMSCSEGRTAVSPFVCLSGNTELDLLNADTLGSVILRTIGITAANLPVLCSKMHDNQGRLMPLNAYVLDFYKHGSLAAMAQDNSLHEGEAYYLLRDFALVLKAISVSLGELCDNKDDTVVQAFKQLSQEYWEKLEKT
ncbi:probable ATP-dependent RNA helicase DDX60 [Heteronotia binoei]|uniref:probable ATP-dependent RNA helicase DDX60 n=1 Tax=Heteronotia binoei TaxID=13085 RepID=UPI0029317850|nr:probable ATP-dependent RNA helicase DDX60 [Heteronotia binoei]